ncbi:MAG: hypothetical protein L0216_13240 [Planctomycetales bacterium]|nr:hypothetical protein [Planctomycetales bacterium]
MARGILSTRGPAVLLALIACGLRGAEAQEAPRIPLPVAVKPALDACRDLAARGRRGEMEEILECVAAAGLPPAEVEALRRTHTARAVAADTDPSSLPAVADLLRVAARRLVPGLETVEGEERARLADAILRLDGSLERPRAVLGDRMTPAGWRSPADLARDARRREILEALDRVEYLDVPVEERESDHPALTQAAGRPGVCASGAIAEIHTSYPQGVATRILREATRAAALSQFLQTGELRAPDSVRRTWILLDSDEAFERAHRDSQRAGSVFPDHARGALDSGRYWDTRGYWVYVAWCARQFAAVVTRNYLLRRPPLSEAQPWAQLGHLDWVGRAYLETGGASFVPAAVHTEARPAQGAQEQPLDDWYQPWTTGLAGCRHRVADRVRQGFDPPWHSLLVKDGGKIQGDTSLKATVVVHHLQELGPLDPVLAGLETGPGDVPSVTEAALGRLADLDRAWRDGLLRGRASLAERLDPPRPLVPRPGEQALLRAVNQVRSAAFASLPSSVPRETSLDPALTEACRLHARYLRALGLAAPPTLEDPGRETFTPEGAWSGRKGLADSGGASPEAAVARWIAGIRGPVALLDPELAAIGAGGEGAFQVADARSLTRRLERSWRVCWPADGQHDVPRARTEEDLSQPEGRVSAGRGYPVSLQQRGANAGSVVRNLLVTEGPDGPEVEGDFRTSYDASLSGRLPPHVFLFVPRTVLKSHTNYHVAATLGDGSEIRWSFRTGR